jgi:hypothetical protein
MATKRIHCEKTAQLASGRDIRRRFFDFRFCETWARIPHFSPYFSYCLRNCDYIHPQGGWRLACNRRCPAPRACTDPVSGEFEVARKSAAPPRIEDFLKDLATVDRAELLNELIRLDIHHRRRAGERPGVREYFERFPEIDSENLAVEIASESMARPPSAAGHEQFPAGSVLSAFDDPTRIHLRNSAEDESPPRQLGDEKREFKSIGKLRIQEQIGRGDLGAVLRGRDVDLGRDFAVKVLLEAHADSPDFVRRFVEEAQIAGQLQHPGVIPVYKLGKLPDARLCFTMKLVKGQTLEELLRERAASHAVEVENAHADLPRFLKIFEQILPGDGLRPCARRHPPRLEAVERDGREIRRGLGFGPKSRLYCGKHGQNENATSRTGEQL